jgi:peroxiredoxin
MKLSVLLQEALEKSNAQFPPQALEVVRAAQKEMLELGLEKTARGVGDYLADATLKSATGEDVSLMDLNENGPLIVTFYRGGWCPYCNLELRAYQKALDKITDRGGQLVAITPEKPDNSLTTIEKNALAFPILTDTGNTLAKEMGITFEIPRGLQELFTSFGLNIPEVNAETGWALPVPATFVVDGTGKIVLADVDVDYTRRLEPMAAIEALKSCPYAAGCPNL